MKKYLYKVGIWPLRLYWFIFRPTTYGVKCVIKHEGKILYIRNTYGKGHWNFPGGRIDKGESPNQAIIREVYEEVGIKMKSLCRVGSFLSTIEFKHDNIYVFSAQAESSDVQIDKTEIREFKWLQEGDLPEPFGETAVQVLLMVNREKNEISRGSKRS